MATEWTLPVSRTARYSTLGTFDSSVRDCWVVCHGYGQLAAGFVTEFIQARTENDALRVTAMGFSQGTATICRWVGRGSVRPARVVLWGGPLLPDEELAEVAERLAETRFTLVVGTRDRYVGAAALQREIGRFKAFRIPHDVITFDGGHRLDGGILRHLAAW